MSGRTGGQNGVSKGAVTRAGPSQRERPLRGQVPRFPVPTPRPGGQTVPFGEITSWRTCQLSPPGGGEARPRDHSTLAHARAAVMPARGCSEGVCLVKDPVTRVPPTSHCFPCPFSLPSPPTGRHWRGDDSQTAGRPPPPSRTIGAGLPAAESWNCARAGAAPASRGAPRGWATGPAQ